MPTTHAHNFSPILLDSLSTTPLLHIPSPMFPDLLQQPFSRLSLGILFLSPISSLCSVSKPICNLWVVLQFPHVSYINLSFQQVDCTDCYLLHAGFLFGLFFNSEDEGDVCFRNTGLTFNRLHGFVSRNIEIFMTTVASNWNPTFVCPWFPDCGNTEGIQNLSTTPKWCKWSPKVLLILRSYQN